MVVIVEQVLFWLTFQSNTLLCFLPWQTLIFLILYRFEADMIACVRHLTVLYHAVWVRN